MLGFNYVISASSLTGYQNFVLGAVGAAIPSYRIVKLIKGHYISALLILLLFLALTLLLLFPSVSRMIRTFRQISLLATEIAHGGLASRIKTVHHDELGDMVSSINLMADSLESSLTAAGETRRDLDDTRKRDMDIFSMPGASAASMIRRLDKLDEQISTSSKDSVNKTGVIREIGHVRKELYDLLLSVRRADAAAVLPEAAEEPTPLFSGSGKGLLLSCSAQIQEKVEQLPEFVSMDFSIAEGMGAVLELLEKHRYDIILVCSPEKWSPLDLIYNKQKLDVLKNIPVVFLETVDGTVSIPPSFYSNQL